MFRCINKNTYITLLLFFASVISALTRMRLCILLSQNHD